MGTQFIIHLVMLFTQSWTVIILMSLCTGLLTPIRMQVGYNYILEFCPKRNQVTAGTLYMMFDMVVYMVTVLYFWKISIEWVPYYSIALVFNGVAFCGSLWLPESPRMLLELGREDEAIANLERMANFNGK